MENIFIFRHGQSYFNQLKKYTGNLDAPLTINGVKQARHAALNFSYNIDVMYSSSLSRSVETALVFARTYLKSSHRIPLIIYESSKNKHTNLLHVLPIIIDKRLNERNYGVVQGLSSLDVLDDYGKKLVYDWKNTLHAAPDEAERLFDVKNRIDCFVNDVVYSEENVNKNIAIFSHQNIIKMLDYTLVNPNMVCNGIDNCSYKHYTIDEQRSVQIRN